VADAEESAKLSVRSFMVGVPVLRLFGMRPPSSSRPRRGIVGGTCARKPALSNFGPPLVFFRIVKSPSCNLPRATIAFLILLTLMLVTPGGEGRAAPATGGYRLDLVARPTAPFPFLKRFGSINLSLYPGGVRGESLFLSGFSRSGSPTITVENPISRMYGDLPIGQVGTILRRLGGSSGAVMPELYEFPIDPAVISGKVNGIRARRFRVVLGPEAWIDVWTTTEIPENRQFRVVAEQALEAISPSTVNVARKIPGTPVYIEMQTRRFRKLAILEPVRLTRGTAAEESAKLSVRSFMVGVPVLRLFE
jgi:hypothetical protein